MKKTTTSIPLKPEAPTEAQAREAMEKHVAAVLKEQEITVRASKIAERLKARIAKKQARYLADKKSTAAILFAYAEANPELFREARKTELYGGHEIGYQTGQPAVEYIRPPGEGKKQTDEGFLKALHALGGEWETNFIRKIEEPNKEAILAARREAEEISKTVPEQAFALDAFDIKLASYGAKVSQGEAFVIRLNIQPVAKPTKGKKAAKPQPAQAAA
jgi:hypothetical protein